MVGRSKIPSQRPTSVRLPAAILKKLEKTSISIHKGEATLIRDAITRCLTDGRWSASPNATGSSAREKELYEAFVELCRIVSMMAFAVDEALDTTSRKRRIEARNLAHDALVHLQEVREKLGVS